MRILSFDVGIKNMAYCLLEMDSSNISIIDWSIINLMDETSSHICTISQKNGKTCKSKAKFMLNNNYYCEKHAKSSNRNYPVRPMLPTQTTQTHVTSYQNPT